MTDLMIRLRDRKLMANTDPWLRADNLCVEAADRIEQLEAALRVLAPMVDWLPHPYCVKAEMTIRQALETKHD